MVGNVPNPARAAFTDVNHRQISLGHIFLSTSGYSLQLRLKKARKKTH